MKSLDRRVVITGVGLVTSWGTDTGRFWSNLLGGVSAVQRIQRFDVSAFPTQIAAEITRFQSQDPEQPTQFEDGWRIEQYGLSAAWSSIQESKLSLVNLDRIGLVLAEGIPTYGLPEFLHGCAVANPDGTYRAKSFIENLQQSLGKRSAERNYPGNTAAAIANRYNLKGPV